MPKVARPVHTDAWRIARAALAAGALILPLVAGSACGGDEAAAPTTSETSTENGEGFHARANAICEMAVAEAAQIPAPSTLSQMEHALEQVQPLNERWNDQFRALTPPPDLEDEFDDALVLLKQDEELLAQLLEAAAARDQQRVEEVLAKYEALTAKEDRLWLALGLETCTEIRFGEPSV
jgi:hypothetical protein